MAMPTGSDFVKQLLSSYKVVVISKSRCSYCATAKSILSKYEIPPSSIAIVEIDHRPDCETIQKYLKIVTGAATVPRVFVNGRCLGGCTDTEKLHKNGLLKPILCEAGVSLP